MFFYERESVAFHERKPILQLIDLSNAPGEGARIPARRQPFSVFASFYETGAWRHDSSALNAIPEDGLERFFSKRLRRKVQGLADIGLAEGKR